MGQNTSSRRQYIAPEILCEGEEAIFQTEQYILGVVFIEALTGRFIRTHANDLKLLKYVREDLEDRLLEIDELSSRLARVLRRMVATNAQSRYSDLGQVAEALSRATGFRRKKGSPELTVRDRKRA